MDDQVTLMGRCPVCGKHATFKEEVGRLVDHVNTNGYVCSGTGQAPVEGTVTYRDTGFLWKQRGVK